MSKIEKAVYFLNPGRNLNELFAGATPFPYERIFWGSESCARLLPERGALEELCQSCRRLAIKLTLVTPLNLDDRQLESLSEVLAFSEDSGAVDEVVFNDWGALELLQGFKQLQPVLGRALLRPKRDPRVMHAELTPAEQAMQGLNHLTNPFYLRFLCSRGVSRVMVDHIPGGCSLEFSRLGIEGILCYPFVPVSYSGYCVMGSSHTAGREKYALSGHCRQECLRYAVELKGMNVNMIQKGVYMYNDKLKPAQIAPFSRVLRVFV